MDSKKQDSPIKQFGFNAGMVRNAMNTINNSTIGQQWASRNSKPAPTTAQNINPNTAAMMNVAARPLFGAGSMASNMAKEAVGYGGITGIPTATNYNGIAPTAEKNFNPRINMNTRPQTPVNPRALGNNTSTITSMYGRSMPGSFNRNMGPLAQMADPLTGQIIDPAMDPNMDPNTGLMTGQPVPPPMAIQDESQITPNQGFNNI